MVIFSLEVSFFTYMVGLLVFCFKYKHLLLLLLSFEFIVLSLYLGYLFVNVCVWILFFNNFFINKGVRGCFSFIRFSLYNSFLWNDYFQFSGVLW